MQTDKQKQILGSLITDQYKKRLQKVHQFEEISGGGIVKKIQRLLVAPSIYIPYLIFAKAKMSRFLPTTITLFWGRKLRIPLDDYDALILSMYGGLYGLELHLTKFFIKNLGPNDVFYDIGANRGFYTFLATELCKETHTFEPMTELIDVIKKNVRKGDNIVVNSMALSDKDGVIDFYIMESSMVNTIDPSVTKESTFKKVTVPTITLDTYVANNTKPTFLKIDAEGAEERILKGGTDFFSSHAPVVAMEIWGKNNKWQLSMSAAEKLRSMGYKSFRVDSEGDIKEVFGDLSEDILPDGGDNFIFKK